MPIIFRRLLPAAVVLVATAWAVRSGFAATIPAARWSLALQGVLVAAFLFAWRLRSTRTARAAVLLALLSVFLARPLDGDVWLLSGLLVPLVVPLDFAWIAWLREASLSSRRSGLLFGLLALEALALSPTVLDRLAVKADDLMPWWPSAALAVGISLVALRLVLRPTPLAAGWLGTLVAVVLALHSNEALRSEESVVWLVAAGLVLLLALVERAFGFAFEDTLTGLPGRRALDQRLREIGGRYVIAMVDIDHFKRVNDRHGHEVGDQALRWVAGRLRGVDGGGTAYRYGGEEFALIFAGKTVREVGPHLEALREHIASEPFTLRAPGRPQQRPRQRAGAARSARAKKPVKPKTAKQGQSLKLTVSIGAAARNEKARTPEQVIQAADRALYRAKKAGRNRTTLVRS